MPLKRSALTFAKNVGRPNTGNRLAYTTASSESVTSRDGGRRRVIFTGAAEAIIPPLVQTDYIT